MTNLIERLLGRGRAADDPVNLVLRRPTQKPRNETMGNQGGLHPRNEVWVTPPKFTRYAALAEQGSEALSTMPAHGKVAATGSLVVSHEENDDHEPVTLLFVVCTSVYGFAVLVQMHVGPERHPGTQAIIERGRKATPETRLRAAMTILDDQYDRSEHVRLIRAAETAQELEERKLQARYERELALHDAGYGEPAGAGQPQTRPPESSPEEEADDETTAGGEECPKRKTRLQELLLRTTYTTRSP